MRSTPQSHVCERRHDRHQTCACLHTASTIKCSNLMVDSSGACTGSQYLDAISEMHTSTPAIRHHSESQLAASSRQRAAFLHNPHAACNGHAAYCYQHRLVSGYMQADHSSACTKLQCYAMFSGCMPLPGIGLTPRSVKSTAQRPAWPTQASP